MQGTQALRELGEMLREAPAPGEVTDFAAARALEAAAPNVMNAWTHAVPALTRYSKRAGRHSIFGRDKTEKAYNDLLDKLHLVILGLYGDGVLLPGATVDGCLYFLVDSLVAFKRAYPNWQDGYSAANSLFVEGSEEIKSDLKKLQELVEGDLF